MLSCLPCQSPQSAIKIHLYSHPDLVRGVSYHCPDHVRVHHQLSESACIVAIIFSEDSHFVTLVLSEPNDSYQYLHV